MLQGCWMHRGLEADPLVQFVICQVHTCAAAKGWDCAICLELNDESHLPFETAESPPDCSRIRSRPTGFLQSEMQRSDLPYPNTIKAKSMY